MNHSLAKHLFLLFAVTLAAQAPHLFAKWDETLWGMEGSFYGIGVKNFFRFDFSDHHGLLVQNGSPEVEEPIRYYARTLVPFYWAEGLSVYLFGDKEWAYRIVPAIHGWLLAMFLYLLVREVGNPKTALIAGIFAGASPMVGYYSTCTYSGPAACYIPALLWAYFRWEDGRHPARTGVLVLFLFLCWAGNVFNSLFIPALWFLHFVRTGRWFRFGLGLVLSCLAVHGFQIIHILTVDPTLQILVGNVSKWMGQSAERAGTGYSLSLIANTVYVLARLLTPFVFGMALFGFVSKGFKESTDSRWSILALLFPGIALCLILPKHTLVHEHDFYWLVAPLAWLAALGVQHFLATGRPGMIFSGILLFLVAGIAFYRGNESCWYEPGSTILSLTALSLPMIGLASIRILGVHSRLWTFGFIAVWVASSIFYTSTLWGESTRVEEALWVRGQTFPSERIATTGRVYPIDLYYSERSISPISLKADSDGVIRDERLLGLRADGFDYLFISSRTKTRIALGWESVIAEESGALLVDLETSN